MLAKAPTILTPSEIDLASNYVLTGGSHIAAKRAKQIISKFGLNNALPRCGYELTLEASDHQNLYLMNHAGLYILRIWTSVSAPWLDTRK